jgi:inner membrane protein
MMSKTHIAVGVAASLAVLAVGLLAADWLTKGELSSFFLAHLGPQQIAGVLAFLALSVIGAHTTHRSFTHSLLGLVLFAGALWLVCALVVPAFVVGFVSHIALDVLNKTPVRILFPARRGFCLGLCRADGAANEVLLVAGILASGAMLGMRLLA